MNNVNEGLLSIPYELQIQIKEYLSNNDLKNYDLTCELISVYKPKKDNLILRRCGILDVTYKDLRKNRWFECGHMICVQYIVNKFELESRCYSVNYISMNPFRVLMEKLGIINNREYSIVESFRCACRDGKINIVKYFLETEGFKITKQDICGPSRSNYALNQLSLNGHFDIIKYLFEEIPLDLRLNVDDVRGEGGLNTPFCWAAMNGHLNIVKYFTTEVGLGIDDIRADNNYAIRLASDNGQDEVVDYLKGLYLEQHADRYYQECSIQ